MVDNYLLHPQSSSEHTYLFLEKPTPYIKEIVPTDAELIRACLEMPFIKIEPKSRRKVIIILKKGK